jgi:F0F1-type ATP synthase assembly protein I
MSKLEEQLSVILEKSLSIAEKSGEFIIEQAPLLLQEFYQWHTATHIMGSLLFLLTLIPFIYFYKAAEWDYGDSFKEVMSITFGTGSILTIIVSIVNIYQLAFITVAPKLYLIEYFVK